MCVCVCVCVCVVGVAAGLGLQKAIQLCPQLQNSCVTVLGCPAEEGEGGKIKMIENGLSQTHKMCR